MVRQCQFMAGAAAAAAVKAGVQQALKRQLQVQGLQ
jgi:hypothetical protein